MAKVVAVKPPSNVTLTLELSSDEAERLKAMMQNEWYENEGEVVRAMRECIWNALRDVGVAST